VLWYCAGTVSSMDLPYLSVPGLGAEGGHRRQRKCSSLAGGTGPSLLAASGRNSLPRQDLLNTHQGAHSFPGQESGNKAVKLFMEEKVYPRAQLASTPHIGDQSFDLPALSFQRQQVTYREKLDWMIIVGPLQLQYSILFYPVLFYSILFYSILF